MNVTWVHFGAIVTAPSGPGSTLASARLRVLVPGSELARRGHAVRYARFHTNADDRAIMTAAPGDVVVISKLSSTSAIATRYFARKTVSLMRRLRHRGVRVAVDMSDYQFDKPELAALLSALPGLADGVIACTDELAAELRARAGVEARVIGDPVEGARGAPRAPRADAPLRLLWFGHQSNLAALQDFLPRLRDCARRTPLSLQVVTAAGSGAEALAADGPLPVSFTPWSRAAQEQALAECDVVLIPSRLDTAVQRSKSANRIVAGAWAGRFVVASPVPSYRPFAQWLWVSEDLPAGLEFARTHRDQVAARIAAAQAHIEAHHAPALIARRWEEALGGLAGAPRRAAAHAPAADAPIGLHLGNGCGNLDGWLNLHLEPARAEPPPDMVCDLNDLVFFEDASIDALAAVQVLQHLAPEQVAPALAEWRRVLRPGASLAIECPDLAALCGRIAAAGAAGAAEQAALFGAAPRHGTRLPYRSGHTEQSLGALMRAAGLANVRREAPVHSRGEWVMRMVGEVGED